VYLPAISGKDALLAASFEHNKTPNHTPAGKGLITLYAAPDWSRSLIDEDDGAITEKLLQAGQTLVPDIDDQTLFTHVTRWPYSWMQSHPGYWTAMHEFRARGRVQDSLIQLAGDYFCTSNINSASTAGERAARDLIAAMRIPSRNKARRHTSIEGR
jgi:oxygen-dependent protoporphyrinogen oxidase